MESAVAEKPSASPSPLSDSLTDMIDLAFADPGDVTPEQPAEKPAQETPQPDRTPAKGKAAEVEGKKTETPKEKPKEDPAKAEQKPEQGKPDRVTVLEKKLNEQTGVNSRLGRELKAANDQIKVLQSKIDGTFVEPEQPTKEQADQVAEFRGKEVASRRMASEKYGEEFVNSQIYDDNSPYQQLHAKEPWWHARVAHSDHPVEEALRILRERKVYEELGADPDQWERILTEKIRPQVLAELQQQQADTSTMVGKAVPSVGDARGAAEGREAVKVEEEFSLASMGGHFLD